MLIFEKPLPLATRPDMEAYMLFDIEHGQASFEAWLPGENPHADRVASGLLRLCPAPGHVPSGDLDMVVGKYFRETADRIFAGASITKGPDGRPHGALTENAQQALAELEEGLRKNGNRRRKNWSYVTCEAWFAEHPAVLDNPFGSLYLDHLATIHVLEGLKNNQVLHRPDVLAHLEGLRRQGQL